MVDAVVIGAGQNGLVAANILADAGWDVLVLEEQPEPGGSVRSAAGPAPGFVTDLCSAFYPLTVASRAYQALALQDYGLRWVHAPSVLAHPLLDGRAAVLSRDLATTVAGLDELGAGDGTAWERLYGSWQRLSPMLLDALFVPFPPVRAGMRLVATLGPAELLKFARSALLPARRVAEEEFSGPGALLLAGCAMHADLMPESTGSGMFGWLLSMLGQQYGFPVPEGGAGELTAAMLRRLRAKGGVVRCDASVREVVVRGGRAVGVRTADGDEIGATRAVLADVPATALYGGLVDWTHLPPRLREDLRRFQWDYATFKIDWALRAPVPWTAAETAGAGTVHVSAGMDEMTEYTAHLAMGHIPAHPFLLAGQMTTSDSCRSPAGTESLWAYTHVPRDVRGDAGGEDITGAWNERDQELFAARMQAQLERFAPGFGDLIIARTLSAPPALAAHNSNLVGGAINGGTTALHQQLVFRPTPALGRPETPIAGLYLASSSAHPGGAVHGACGSNAARAAMRGYRARYQRIAAAATRAAIGR